MNIIEWINDNRPGYIEEFSDRIEIDHHSGEHSTIWKNISQTVPEALTNLMDVYTLYDGMDLFSSTFKVAALSSAKTKGSVELVFTISELEKELIDLGTNFPEAVIPFMYQAGIGYYGIGISTKKIYEWDQNENRLSGVYQSMNAILNEWLDALKY